MATLTTNINRPRRTIRGCRLLALTLGVGALALPASAGAYYDGSGPEPSSTPVAEKGSSDSGLVIPDHTALNESLAPLSGSHEPRGVVDSPPTIVYGAPSAADGFDWADAALGAGIAMALVTLGGATLLIIRRRTEGAPAASTS
jgi:hypothetical protein